LTVTRKIVAFLDDDSDMGVEWGYLIQENADGSGIVEWHGQRREAETLCSPYPLPSANILRCVKLDDWTQKLEDELIRQHPSWSANQNVMGPYHK
jgi:hypothetical protein